jgi:hypothetical protein
MAPHRPSFELRKFRVLYPSLRSVGAISQRQHKGDHTYLSRDVME